jgi:hypothetical protein
MKRISIGLLLALGMVGAIALGSRPSAHAANPAFNLHGGGATSQTLFNVVTSTNPNTNRVFFQSTFTPFSFPPRVTQQIASPVNLTFPNVYFSGTGIVCNLSGTHATGWRGPFTLPSSGNNSISCTPLSFNAASSGWSGGWYAHRCALGENPPAPHRQVVNGVAFCTTGPN